MRYDIFHSTRYEYSEPVHDSFNDVRLHPVPNEDQKVESFLLRVLPAARLSHYVDFYRNWVHHFEIPEPHTYLSIESQSRVNTHPPAALSLTDPVCTMDQLSDVANVERCFDYLQSSRFIDLETEVWRLAIDATHGQTDVWQAVNRLMTFVHGNFKYESKSTNVHTHMRDVINDRRGVCQDFAHLTIGLCRSLKIPARYISGYLATEDVSASHAWVEVFLPGIGWRAIDPTHNRQVGETYVKIGHGRDYADVTPIAGNYWGTLNHTMTVDVKITPVE
jgi:transglutaminase-like putative cysteine protease